MLLFLLKSANIHSAIRLSENPVYSAIAHPSALEQVSLSFPGDDALAVPQAQAPVPCVGGVELAMLEVAHASSCA